MDMASDIMSKKLVHGMGCVITSHVQLQCSLFYAKGSLLMHDVRCACSADTCVALFAVLTS